MKKININYYFVLGTLLLLPQFGYSQDLNLTGGASVMQKALEGIYVIIGGAGFLYVAYQQLDNFKTEGNRLEGLKPLGWYLLVFIAIGQIYKYVISQSL